MKALATHPVRFSQDTCSSIAAALPLMVAIGLNDVSAADVITNQVSGARYAADRILVKPKSPGGLANAHAAFGTQIRRQWPRFGGWQSVKVPPGMTPEQLIALFAARPDVEHAQPVYFYQLTDLPPVEPNDPKFVDNTLWNLKNNVTETADVSGPEAWAYLHDANGVVVAVIDSGVRYTHEDLKMNIWRNPGEIPGNGTDDDDPPNGYIDDVHGIDAVQNNGNPTDCLGHGTHVTGIIAAVGNNGLGVVGVAWNVKIMALRAGLADYSNSIDLEAAIECVDYAISKGANVINSSWAGVPLDDVQDLALQDAIRVAGNAGIPWVTSAGNNGQNLNYFTEIYPARYQHENIVTVVSTTKSDSLWSGVPGSNYGVVETDIGAPGGDSDNKIRSTEWPNGATPTDTAYTDRNARHIVARARNQPYPASGRSSQPPILPARPSRFNRAVIPNKPCSRAVLKRRFSTLFPRCFLFSESA